MISQMLQEMVGTLLFAASMTAQSWFVLALIGLVLILSKANRLPAVKGWIGECQMRLGFRIFLPPAKYRVINNVTIPDGQVGTTQIDHIIVSEFGLFVIETKHYKGWIFGGEHDRQWTQKIHGNHSQKFHNPLLQNYKHTECLRALLGLAKEQVKSVVVFSGEATLKTRDKLPAHMTYPGSCVRYIKGHRDALFSAEEVAALEAGIREHRLTPGLSTARQHKAYVKSLHPAPAPLVVPDDPESENLDTPGPTVGEAAKSCPQCGTALILRKASRGAKAGSQFWGCSNYPKCRHILPA